MLQKQKSTRPANPGDSRKWYLVDAKDQVLGRLAVVIANKLRAKDTPAFDPSVDAGAFVIVVNAARAAVAGFGPIIMGLEDIENVLTAAPYATVIASHLDNVGHATLWRKDIRDFAAKRNLGSRLLIPEDGEICDLP